MQLLLPAVVVMSVGIAAQIVVNVEPPLYRAAITAGRLFFQVWKLERYIWRRK